MQDTLNAEPNLNVIDNKDDRAVQTAIQMIADQFSVANKHRSEIEAIQDMFEQTFDISDPTNTSRKLNSQLLYQALWRTASRMKPLDFMIHGEGRPPSMEKVVTTGVSTVMDTGGLDSTFRDKQGIFFNMLMYGDGMMQIGTNTNKKSGAPILFKPIGIDNVYVDNYATGMRTGEYRSARQCAVIYSYSWSEFCKQFPEAKNKAGVGRIPRESNMQMKQQDRDWEQTIVLEDLVEVCYFYDISKGDKLPNYTIFAGSACTVIEQYSGKDYPFVKDGDPYIPISQWACIPSSEGFWNFGIGHMIYKLAIVSRQLLNMELGHIEDNTYPIELINTPAAEASKFFNKLKLAQQQRAAGKKGFVVNAYDPANPGSGQVSSQTLTTQNLFNEWAAVWQELGNQLRRLGINIDELDRGQDITATQVLAEEESSNAWIKQVMEYNASEMQFVVELTMNFITKFVTKNSKIPLNMTTKIEVEGVEVRPDNITLGDISDELRKHRYFVKVNSRTGSIPSNLMLQAQIGRVLPLMQPGSPGWVKGATQLAQLNDIEVTGQEMLMQQMAAPGGAPAGPAMPEELDKPIGSETSRMSISPRLKEQIPV